MAAFKPYKFVLFDKNVKNSNLYKQIIAHLDLSILCKEIYVSEKFCHFKYDHVSRNKLVYFSDHNLIDKLKRPSLDRNIEENLRQFASRDMQHAHDCTDEEDKFESKKRHTDSTIEKESEMLKNKMHKNDEKNMNTLVSFFTYDEKEKDQFFNTLNLNRKYEVDHINILSLSNCDFIVDALRRQPCKQRISIFCPYYIIHDEGSDRGGHGDAHLDGSPGNFEGGKGVPKRLSDFLYTIVSDFLPMSYKHILMSDLIRAIIVNSELCQGRGREDVEVLKFMDMMQIIGKAA
ncbi:conserved Plasmodium protein, unknown function [Plasmodium knowlesi strain H]|uniref:Uncharacterized protein n=3 Tax=Plasmodium knowlesi TaxID=5850 RepID=A0A5K1USI6_PLAKH|nr:conserved Plasmodium protein, unknown function [Plasmodium knowlesi strain H]OTN65889.1 Uncharacterized protein PKNOH_S100033100 [Plasmodium knowlesi]CAA9987696.1 conserved Plasmodium protein, unknown function [Plasmodium knowlesi strain H]SBO26915.1 conserved Plasmodium protein, unknown function [Plasmodium knowlesi strain H]SBO29626.1 conserved Plasmodium protein, unknown function [Plasmodium knowlesi strain H]VVS77170.1 conserved Plasmodium protein, unknown function [Plasmodium knowlesi |eukprot:XP_002258694.1 hypothetical protein, conserved in Plasmodium species [Plasmodium knowlesi strain H]